MNEIKYISQADGTFYELESGLIAYKSDEKDYGRVAVLRMFPLQYSDEYLSVRTENYARGDKNEEIGIIRNLQDFDDLQKAIINRELQKRYFIPEIVEVLSIEEEFANSMWSVETTAGKVDFTVNDMGSNLLDLGNNKIMLTDVFGNRYIIPDVTKIGDKALQVLEIWI